MKKGTEEIKGYIRYQNAGFEPRYAKGTDEQLYWVQDKKEATLFNSLESFFNQFPLIVEERQRYSFEPLIEEPKEKIVEAKYLVNINDLNPTESSEQGVILNLELGLFYSHYSSDGIIFKENLEDAQRFNSFEDFCEKFHILESVKHKYSFVPLSKIIQVKEKPLGKENLGNPPFIFNKSESSTKTILQEAQDVVYGDRQADYGSVTSNFTTIAKLWSAVLGINVSPEQVGLCMIQVKVAREMNKPKRDNLVDICGYAACIEKMEIENENLPF